MKVEDVSNLLKVNNRSYKVQEWSKNSNVFVFDCGGRKDEFFVLDASKKKCFSISKQDFLDFPSKNPNSIFIIEYAHMETRKIQSLAQPLSAEEKESFYSNCKSNGIRLRFFPEKMSPKARGLVCNKLNNQLGIKSEKHDVISIYLYLKYVNRVFGTLSSKDNRHSAIAKEARDFRRKTTDILNIARSLDYKNDPISDFIEKNKSLFYGRLSDRTKNYFGIIKNKNGIKIEQHIYVYTILATLLDENGVKRLRKSTNESPGWVFIANRDFCLNANRGSNSKSQLNHHFIRNLARRELKKSNIILKKGKEGKTLNELSHNHYESFRNFRLDVKKSIKEIFCLCKKLVNNQI